MSDHVPEVAEATESILNSLVEGDENEPWAGGTWAALSSAGLTLVAVPESSGGGGGSLREAAEVVRVAGSFALRAPIAETSLLAAWLLERAGIAISTGVLSVATASGGLSAQPDGTGGWILNGTARRIPFGRFAEAVVLVATSEQGLLAVSVDPRAAKLAEGENLAGDPLDELDVSELRVAGSQAAVITADDQEELLVRLALSRLLLCSGAASRILTLTLRHVAEREQFGRPIGRFQAVQQLVAELAGEVAALQIGVDAALMALESGAPTAWLAVASAKTDADRSVGRLTAIAHQLHGAIGVTHEHALRRFTLRLWSWREEGGTGSFWAEAIAGRLLAPGAEPLWEQIVGE